METPLPYLFVAAVIVVLAWSWHFHFWSNSPTARRSRSPLWLGFTATAASALFLIAGIIGLDLSKRGSFFKWQVWFCHAECFKSRIVPLPDGPDLSPAHF